MADTPNTTVEEIRNSVKVEYESRFEAWKAKELANLEEKQNQTIQEEIQKVYKKIQDEQKPLTREEIQQLVDQEYAQIEIKIPVENTEGEINIEAFTLRELPQSVERKFYRQFRERLKNKGSELAAFTQRNQDVPFEKMLLSFLDTFDGGFDVLADAAVLILNPRGKRMVGEQPINAVWIADNLSSNRIYSIILAQVEVNKLRDFFLRIFQSGQKVEMLLTAPNTRQLHQLAR